MTANSSMYVQLMTKNQLSLPQTPLLAFDTDWVPQFLLDFIFQRLVHYGVTATFFCSSPYSFPEGSPHECALHPNFMPDSTQGKTPKEILANLKAFYPNAQGSRSHRLFWHAGLRTHLLQAGVRYNATTFTPLQPCLSPWFFKGLWHFSIWWSDGLQMDQLPLNRFAPPSIQAPGLKICVFHPIHIWLNSQSMEQAKARLAGINLPFATWDELMRLREHNTREGIEVVFEDFLRQAAKKPSQTLSELLPISC